MSEKEFNMEKYISLDIDGLRFVDSLQLLSCSMDGLVKNWKRAMRTRSVSTNYVGGIQTANSSNC